MNNNSIALNVLHALNSKDNKRKISRLHKSGFNKKGKQVILLIISDNQKRHYVAVKNLNSLLKD